MLYAFVLFTTRLIFNIYILLIIDVGNRVKSIIQKMYHNLMILEVCAELFCRISLLENLVLFLQVMPLKMSSL